MFFVVILVISPPTQSRPSFLNETVTIVSRWQPYFLPNPSHKNSDLICSFIIGNSKYRVGFLIVAQLRTNIHKKPAAIFLRHLKTFYLGFLENNMKATKKHIFIIYIDSDYLKLIIKIE